MKATKAAKAMTAPGSSVPLSLQDVASSMEMSHSFNSFGSGSFNGFELSFKCGFRILKCVYIMDDLVYSIYKKVHGDAHIDEEEGEEEEVEEMVDDVGDSPSTVQDMLTPRTGGNDMAVSLLVR